MQYWLMKSEPDEFSIDHLQSKPGKTGHWDGVRNYQARNMMRDQMKKGDQIFFYHSSCATPGIVGIMKVEKESYPDVSALNPQSKYYDPKSTEDNPRWVMIDVKFVRKFKRVITLTELKQETALHDMPLVQKGSRLSISPVTAEQWNHILAME